MLRTHFATEGYDSSSVLILQRDPPSKDRFSGIICAVRAERLVPTVADTRANQTGRH